MKKFRFLLSALMLFVAAVVTPVFAQDFAGKWHIKMTNSPMGDMEFDMTFTKAEDGTWSAEMAGGMAEIKKLEVKDNKMTITTSAMGMEIPFELTLKEDDTLEGNIMGSIKLNGTRVTE